MLAGVSFNLPLCFLLCLCGLFSLKVCDGDFHREFLGHVGQGDAVLVSVAVGSACGGFHSGHCDRVVISKQPKFVVVVLYHEDAFTVGQSGD